MITSIKTVFDEILNTATVLSKDLCNKPNPFMTKRDRRQWPNLSKKNFSLKKKKKTAAKKGAQAFYRVTIKRRFNRNCCDT